MSNPVENLEDRVSSQKKKKSRSKGTPQTPKASPGRKRPAEPTTTEPSKKKARIELIQGTAPKKIAILTSGGDSQGMNPAVRAVVRAALHQRAEVYGVENGWQGLVDGGEAIKPLTWGSVAGIMPLGGTILGTARCMAFKTKEGRKSAVYHLLQRGIDGIVVIGGDGSLTGASVLQNGWAGLVQEIVDDGLVSAELAEKHAFLAIVGLAGSIDNDMCGTDLTIGADSSLHRIVEAVDCLTSTAASHYRTFVVEVMGRDCGWLALMAALCTSADWAILPECPPESEDWVARMCARLNKGRELGRKHSLIVVAEGAKDKYGLRITPQYIKEVVEARLKHDTRITILGHVQRGGQPSAYDRYMSSLCGAEAASAVLEATAASGPLLIGIQKNIPVRCPLMECVKRTQSVNPLVQQNRLTEVQDIRGEEFKQLLRHYNEVEMCSETELNPGGKKICLLHVGAPAPGMNPCVRALARGLIVKGFQVHGAIGGFTGLVNGKVEALDWMSVSGFNSKGGAALRTGRETALAVGMAEIAAALTAHSIDGLILVGGFEAFTSVAHMERLAGEFEAFKIPLVVVPATISNNLPNVTFSIGCDTATNAIVQALDRIKQSAYSSNQRLFVVEVMGQNCGYLGAISAVASGAECVYLPEERVDLRRIADDVHKIKLRFERGCQCGLLIRCDGCPEAYNTSVLSGIFGHEGNGTFTTRSAVLGHLQQGGSPSPRDRILGIAMAGVATEYMTTAFENGTTAACLVDFDCGALPKPVSEAAGNANGPERKAISPWWLPVMLPMHNLLAVDPADAEAKPLGAALVP